MKILVIENHKLFAEGLCTLLKEFDKAIRVVSFTSCESAVAETESDDVDLVLTDYYLTGLSGVPALKALQKRFANTPVIFVSALEDPLRIWQVVDAGAAGFIPKTSSFSVMSAAIKVVLAGGIYLPPSAIKENSSRANSYQSGDSTCCSRLDCLSRRQHEVLMQVVQGKPNKAIAKALDISEHTVKAHISASFKLLGVKNRTEAVYAAAMLNREEPVLTDKAEMF